MNAFYEFAVQQTLNSFTRDVQREICSYMHTEYVRLTSWVLNSSLLCSDSLDREEH